MTYAKIENGTVAEYPIYPADIVERFPNTSFPTPFSPPEGYEKVELQPHPEVDHTENLSEIAPTFVDGVLTQQWAVEPATEEEIAKRTEAMAFSVRQTRDALLQQSDWTQIWDATCDKDAWAEYRQALRDITSQPGFPWEIGWPEKP